MQLSRFKKVVSLLLCVIFGAGVLMGCVLFSFDEDRDMRLVVAEVHPILFGLDEDGQEVWSEKRTIYKRDLVIAFNQQGGELINRGMSFADAYAEVLDRLIIRELLVIEADRLVHHDQILWDKHRRNVYDENSAPVFKIQQTEQRNAQGELFDAQGVIPLDELGVPTRPPVLVDRVDESGNPVIMVDEHGRPVRETELIDTFTQTNEVKRQVYAQIDNELMSLQNQILSERNRDPIPDNTRDPGLTEPSFPVLPDESTPVAGYEDELWEPSLARRPGGEHLDLETQSLELNAVRRFVALIIRLTDDDFRIPAPLRVLMDEEKTELEGMLGTLAQVREIYPTLHDRHMVQWLLGRRVEEQIKVELLRDAIAAGAHLSEGAPTDLVTPDAILMAYETRLADQMRNFRANPDAYDGIASNEHILYRPHDRIFYVKHILIPFSEAQTESLRLFRLRPDTTPKEAHDFRANLGSQVRGFRRVNGENDLRNGPMTIEQIYNQIEAAMAPAMGSRNLPEAERIFRELIYTFNTDPGMFGNDRGYAVTPRGVQEQFVIEFAEEARDLRVIAEREGRSGGVLGRRVDSQDNNRGHGFVLTDFGWHLLYLSEIPAIGISLLDDDETPSGLRTHRDIIMEGLVGDREDEMFRGWQDTRIRFHMTQLSEHRGVSNRHSVTVFNNRFRNLHERADREMRR